MQEPWHVATARVDTVRVARKLISAHSVVGKGVGPIRPLHCVVLHNLTPTVIAHVYRQSTSTHDIATGQSTGT